MRRGGGGFRGGGGRGLGGGGRIGGGRSLGGGAGRSARGMGSGGGLGGGLGRPAARPAPRRGPGFGTGFGLGMGMGMMGGRRRGWGWGGGWGWGRRRRMGMMPMGGMGPRGGCGGGCMGIMFAVILVIIVLSAISMAANMAFPAVPVGGGQVTRSTVNRTALSRDRADTSVPTLVDDLRWIGNTALLNRGINNFHNRTGVRPILYITGSIDGNTNPTFAQISEFADRRYTELTGGCEAHLLLLIFESATMEEAYVRVGSEARVVIDEEAYNIILDYVVRHWGSRMNEDELFSRVFDDSSQRIMRVDRSPWIPVLIVAGILLILQLLFSWWKRKQEQKNLEAEQTERILSQPLETIGGTDDAASQLAQQYEDDNDN